MPWMKPTLSEDQRTTAFRPWESIRIFQTIRHCTQIKKTKRAIDKAI